MGFLATCNDSSDLLLLIGIVETIFSYLVSLVLCRSLKNSKMIVSVDFSGCCLTGKGGKTVADLIQVLLCTALNLIRWNLGNIPWNQVKCLNVRCVPISKYEFPYLEVVGPFSSVKLPYLIIGTTKQHRH